jgi:hypothetical protein
LKLLALAQAAADYTEAVRLNPKDAAALNALASPSERATATTKRSVSPS